MQFNLMAEMSSFDQTGYFITILFIIGLAWDLYQFRKKDGCTVSRWVRTMATNWPVLVLLLGILLGHFFFWN